MHHKQSLLMVEDDPDFAESLKLLFSIRELVAEVVHSGEEALGRFDPDLHAIILMDIRLPGISGVDTLLQIRERHPDFPVLLMTGCDQNSAEVSLAKAAGATDLIFKPFNINQMLDRIESLWQKRQQVNQ